MSGSLRLTSDADAPVRRRSEAWPAPGIAPLAGVALAATTATALWLTARSLGWPLVHDGPLMHYVAGRLLEGAVPYRDLFDMNFPGVYLVHVLGLALLGPGDAGFRALDLLLLGGTAAGLGVAVASFGGWAVVSAIALFWLYHVAGGAWRAGQRDLILCFPLAWMTAGALAYLRSRRMLPLGLAGLSLGAAIWIKPHAVLLLPVLAALAWRAPSRGRALGVLALGIGAPAVPVLGWLAAVGALASFLDIVGGYLLPLYGGLGRVSLVDAILDQDLGVAVLAGLVLWASAGAVALRRSARSTGVDGRLAVLGAGVAYGALHYAVQGKGWEYHLYPFALFAVALGAAGFGVVAASGRRAAAVVLAVALLGLPGVLAAKGLRGLEPAWIAEKQARAQAVARELGPIVAAGGTVQVLDTTDGGVHALFLLHARQPTRFLYDFHFYHDVDHPYVRRLRAELLAGLRARPPAAVVLFERGWPTGDYRRVATFRELATWLATGYRLAHEGDGYRIYAQRSDR